MRLDLGDERAHAGGAYGSGPSVEGARSVSAVSAHLFAAQVAKLLAERTFGPRAAQGCLAHGSQASPISSTRVPRVD
jgi:hypothetical protein